MRKAEISRNTSETKITVKIDLDGSGTYDIDTGIGFLDHMLQLFARHGMFDLTVKCSGDTNVDDHHSTEDTGIALGMAFCKALGDKAGIKRYGNIILPMDEALILSAVDLSGRGALGYSLSIPSQKVGSFDTELVKEFWQAFADNAGCALHLRQLSGINSHHIIEGAFKSAARSLREAVSIDDKAQGMIPSTKGVL